MTIDATDIRMRIGSGGALEHRPYPEVGIGTDWLFFGDSQTAGTAISGTAVDSPHEAFENIWNQTFTTSITRAFDGAGGETYGTSAGEHNYRYTNTSGISTATLVHIQESGGQYAIQDTELKFITLFESFINSVNTSSANAVIMTETAYSFEESTGGTPERNWDIYNAAMLDSIDDFNASGIKVYCAQTDRNIKELVTQKNTELGSPDGQQSVWGLDPDDGDIGNHYGALGNFMVALGYFEVLGYNLDTLDLSNIPVDDVSAADKALCINIIKGF